MGQTVAQGAQNSASTGTATRVALQNAVQALTPVKPPPIVPPPIVPPPIVPPPIVPPVGPAPTATYAMVTPGPFSTSTGPSPVPYLTGAFAGSGGFTVSPILGYQTGGLNADGTPNTTSRQFQAGLSVTGQGPAQNATLFVMTSAISNAPNIGFTQAGGFTGVTMRNQAGWYGLAGGAVSSATPTSAPNTVPTMNGVPIASFTLNNTNTNLLTGAVSNSQSSNFVTPANANYTFNPITTGTPTTLANNHPTLTLNGYVGGVMVTATGGYRARQRISPRPMSSPILTNSPGDVSILLPGDSSEMLAVFNVGSLPSAPNGAMKNSVYVFGSLNGNGLDRAERGARHLRQSVEFRGAGRSGVRQRGQYSCLLAHRRHVPADDRRIRQPAAGDGLERRRQYARVPDLDFFDSRSALRVRIDPVGFLERVQRRNKQQRSTDVRGSGRSVAMGRRRSHEPRKSPRNRHGHLHRPRHRQHRQRDRGSYLSRRRHVF